MPLSSSHAFLLRPPPPTAALSSLPVSSKIPNLHFHKKTHFPRIAQTQTPNLNLKLSISGTHRSIRCSVAVADPSSVPSTGINQNRTSPAEVSRTIMELSRTGTLSTVTNEGWPLGIGARFVVDEQGIPALCLSSKEDDFFSVGARSSFHVQLEQSGSRTPHCTFMGHITKPDDSLVVKKLEANWKKKFGEELDVDLLYAISLEQILHMGDFKERGVWVDCSDYTGSNADPLRDFAEKIVAEMNSEHYEDVQRLRHIYVDTTQLQQVTNTKMIWVDRLGFDLRIQTSSFMGRSNRMDNTENNTGVEFVLKEYFLSVDSAELEITFVPADRSSFAFINAIEVISASTLIPDTVRSMDSDGINKLSGMSKQDYEVLFRINTGGAKITPLNDTMWRNWVPDEDFLNYTANIGMEEIHFSGPIKYPEYGASREIAPDSVYRTARVMKIANLADSADKKNMSWSFSVPSKYNYLVRLHFCDIASMALNDLYFDIYLNGQIAYEDFDISTNSNLVLATPYYLDFVTQPDSSGHLVITIAASKSSKPSKVNGLLNGLEVMKLNNSAGNLDDEPMTMMMGGDGATPHGILVFVRMFLTVAALVSIACAGYMLVVRWRSVSHSSAGWSPLPASTPESCISLESGGKSKVQL